MLPLLPFIAGVAAGATASVIWRQGSVRKGVMSASEKLRSAASNSLFSVRQTSASLRESVAGTLQKAWPSQSASDDAAQAARKVAGTGPARQAAQHVRAHARATAQATSRVAARNLRDARRKAAAASTSKAAAPARRTRKRKA